MTNKQVTLWVDDETLEMAQVVADSEDRSRAYVLNRWLENGRRTQCGDGVRPSSDSEKNREFSGEDVWIDIAHNAAQAVSPGPGFRSGSPIADSLGSAELGPILKMMHPPEDTPLADSGFSTSAPNVPEEHFVNLKLLQDTAEQQLGVADMADMLKADADPHSRTIKGVAMAEQQRNVKAKKIAEVSAPDPSPVKVSQIEKSPVAGSSFQHDPKTCKVYECGRCKAFHDEVF